MKIFLLTFVVCFLVFAIGYGIGIMLAPFETEPERQINFPVSDAKPIKQVRLMHVQYGMNVAEIGDLCGHPRHVTAYDSVNGSSVTYDYPDNERMQRLGCAGTLRFDDYVLVSIYRR